MAKKSQKKSENTNYERQRQFILNALRELSPQNIAMLTQQFLPHIMNAQNAAGQSAIAGLKRSQAMRGLGGSRVALTQEAGLRGQLATGANTAAFQNAMGLAAQRAGVWGQNPTSVQPNNNMANAFQQAIQQGLLAHALTQKKVQSASAPATNYAPVTNPTFNWGIPLDYGQQQAMTPYEQMFNKGIF